MNLLPLLYTNVVVGLEGEDIVFLIETLNLGWVKFELPLEVLDAAMDFFVERLDSAPEETSKDE